MTLKRSVRLGFVYWRTKMDEYESLMFLLYKLRIIGFDEVLDSVKYICIQTRSKK